MGGLLLQDAAGGGKPVWAGTRPEVPGADGRCHPPPPAAFRASQVGIRRLALAEDSVQSADTNELS